MTLESTQQQQISESQIYHFFWGFFTPPRKKQSAWYFSQNVTAGKSLSLSIDVKSCRNAAILRGLWCSGRKKCILPLQYSRYDTRINSSTEGNADFCNFCTFPSAEVLNIFFCLQVSQCFLLSSRSLNSKLKLADNSFDFLITFHGLRGSPETTFPPGICRQQPEGN